MNRIVRHLAAATALLILSGCAVLQEYGPSPDPASDEGIAAMASSRLNSDSMTARSTLSVVVNNGMATLYGTVPDPATRERALQLVLATPGVVDVVDHTRRR